MYISTKTKCSVERIFLYMFWHIAFWYSLFLFFLGGGGGGGGGTSECVQQSILCICTSNVLLDDKTTQSIVNDCYLSLLKVMIAIDENIRKDGKKKEHIISF